VSFIDSIAEQLAAHAAKPLVLEVHGETLVPAPGRMLADLAARARAHLRARGVKPGDRVVLVAPNSIRWVAADLAILFEGAVVVPLYARQEPAELGEILGHCKPTLILCADATLADALDTYRGSVPIVLFEELFVDEPVSDGPVSRSEHDPVTVVYTSGTSGVAKGVVLSAGNVDFMLPRTRDALGAMMGPRSGDDRVFHYLPFCFAGSRVVLWTCLYRGNPIHISTDLENLITELGRVNPHYFLNVPMLLERIKNGVEAALRKRAAPIQWLYRRALAAHTSVAAGEAGKRDRLVLALAKKLMFDAIRQRIGSELECLICGSAPLGEDTQRWFQMLGIPVYQVYGLTETTAIVTMDVPPVVIPGRVGPALEGVQTRLVDEELQVRGPNVFREYLFNQADTEAAFDEGWFRTGDRAEVDATGNWRIVGRVKNLLVPSSGHNVAPEPIEQKLTETIEGVDAAVVVGHGKPYLTAIFSGEGLSQSGLAHGVEAVNAQLPHYRRIRKWQVAEEPFSIENGLLTANRKLKRRAIEAAYAEQIDGMYA